MPRHCYHSHGLWPMAPLFSLYLIAFASSLHNAHTHTCTIQTSEALNEQFNLSRKILSFWHFSCLHLYICHTAGYVPDFVCLSTSSSILRVCVCFQYVLLLKNCFHLLLYCSYVCLPSHLHFSFSLCAPLLSGFKSIFTFLIH